MQLLREESKAEGKFNKFTRLWHTLPISTFRWESEGSLTLHISKSGDILCSDPLSSGDVSPCIRRLRHVSSQGCDTCPQTLLGASRAPGAPKMRVLTIAKTLSRMQSCFAVFWMQSMHIFGLLRISIMDGWTRKADGSQCRVQGGRLQEFPELWTLPREESCHAIQRPAAAREYWLYWGNWHRNQEWVAKFAAKHKPGASHDSYFVVPN